MERYFYSVADVDFLLTAAVTIGVSILVRTYTYPTQNDKWIAGNHFVSQ